MFGLFGKKKCLECEKLTEKVSELTEKLIMTKMLIKPVLELETWEGPDESSVPTEVFGTIVLCALHCKGASWDKDFFSKLDSFYKTIIAVAGNSEGDVDRFWGNQVLINFHRENLAARSFKFVREAISTLEKFNPSANVSFSLATGTLYSGRTGLPNSRCDFSTIGEPLREVLEFQEALKTVGKTTLFVSEGAKRHFESEVSADSSLDFSSVSNTKFFEVSFHELYLQGQIDSTQSEFFWVLPIFNVHLFLVHRIDLSSPKIEPNVRLICLNTATL